MKRCWIFLLLLVPGMAFSAICKTIGADGVASFINVPGNECPAGSALMDYPVPSTRGERVQAVETGVSGRQIPFAGYQSIEITRPEDGGTVRSNEGRVTVMVALEPGLQQSHFITAYLDGRANQGRYGSNVIEFAGVDRGEHRLNVTVKDSKGQVLITSKEITFTLQRNKLDLVVNPITGDDYVDLRDPGMVRVYGCYECGSTDVYEYLDRDKTKRKKGAGAGKTGRVIGPEGAWVTLWFRGRNLESRAVKVRPETTTVERVINTPQGRKTVIETYNWVIKVPRSFLESEAVFDARVRIVPQGYGSVPIKELRALLESLPVVAQTTSSHSVDPRIWKPLPGNFSATPGETHPAFTGVPTTPGQTNPAFQDIPTTPGQTTPAFPGVPTTPGQTNPAFSPN